MEDNIVELQIASFALIVKRRTLIYTFLIVVVLFLAQALFQVRLADRLDLHDPLQDLISDTMHMGSSKPDPSITWEVFHRATSGKTQKAISESKEIESKFIGKIVQWTGTVLRVDSFDEDAEYLRSEGGNGQISDEDIKKEIEDIKNNFESVDAYEKDQFQKTGLYAAQLLIRMSPRFKLPFTPDNTDRLPDLILWLDDKSLEENIDTLDELKRGSIV
jgi:hypothetical protein